MQICSIRSADQTNSHTCVYQIPEAEELLHAKAAHSFVQAQIVHTMGSHVYTVIEASSVTYCLTCS